MIGHSSTDVRNVGVVRVTALAMRIKSKQAFTKIGVLKTLGNLLREPTTSVPMRKKVRVPSRASYWHTRLIRL